MALNYFFSFFLHIKTPQCSNILCIITCQSHLSSSCCNKDRLVAKRLLTEIKKLLLGAAASLKAAPDWSAAAQLGPIRGQTFITVVLLLSWSPSAAADQ